VTYAGDNPVPPIATWLGRAGLLPFVAAPITIYLLPQHAQFSGRVLAAYALSIICFLVGIWWGLGLIRRQASALVLSNAVVLTAFFGYVGLSTGAFLLLCAALFPVTVLVERSLPLFKPQPAYYASLRVQLTAVATAALLLAALALASP
jgi:hypothetical protein